MDAASRMPERIGGLVMGNTWFWPIDSFMANLFSRVMGSRPLQFLITKRNLIVTPLMRRALKAKLADAEFDHYLAVVPTPQSRKGIAEFPKQVRAALPWLAEVERRVRSALSDKPIIMVWGMKDPVFGRGGFLERWEETFPQARVIRLEAAGHFIQEDAPEQIVDAIAGAFGPGSG